MHTECKPSLHLTSYSMWRVVLASPPVAIYKLSILSLITGPFRADIFDWVQYSLHKINYTMKFYLSFLLAFSAINSVLGDEATCNKDAALVNQHKGEKYTQEIVLSRPVHFVPWIAYWLMIVAHRPAKPNRRTSASCTRTMLWPWIIGATGMHP